MYKIYSDRFNQFSEKWFERILTRNRLTDCWFNYFLSVSLAMHFNSISGQRNVGVGQLGAQKDLEHVHSPSLEGYDKSLGEHSCYSSHAWT